MHIFNSRQNGWLEDFDAFFRQNVWLEDFDTFFRQNGWLEEEREMKGQVQVFLYLILLNFPLYDGCTGFESSSVFL